jgi:hypothetical protein
MTDLTAALLPTIRSYRLPELDLPAEMVHPNYGGLSILNTPNSLCHFLDVPPATTLPPLNAEILQAAGSGYERVIVILMDALALHRFQAWLERSPELVWNRLLDQGVLAPLSSIAPSTTSAALTSYWTALPPRVHGITGYEMWMKEYGVVANTILHTPITFKGGGIGSLEHAGFDPAKFLPAPGIGAHLSQHGVSIHAFQHYSIIDSGLSEMFFNNVNRVGCGGAADMWYRVWQLWQQPQSGKTLAWVYWSEVDGLSHLHGPDDPRIEDEFYGFSQAFERVFLNRLTHAEREGTLLILTADHGQITTNKMDAHYDLRNHPDFTRRLHIQPTGENRLTFLYIRPGQTEAVREYIERTWPNQFAVLETPYAIEKGLFGPGASHPSLLDRTGDLTVLARGNAFWWWGAKPNPIIGRHGGLSPDEMLVPFLAVPL